MSRSLAAAVLLAVALVAAAAASEDSNLVEDGAVSVSVTDAANVTAAELTGNKTRPKEDTFADMIDRALEKEFTENEDHNEANDVGSFNNSVAEQQAVLETVARVKPKKNETKEEKSFKFNQVFNLDNDNGAEETPTLIDRKDNVFYHIKFQIQIPSAAVRPEAHIRSCCRHCFCDLWWNCFCLCWTTGAYWILISRITCWTWRSKCYQ